MQTLGMVSKSPVWLEIRLLANSRPGLITICSRKIHDFWRTAVARDCMMGERPRAGATTRGRGGRASVLRRSGDSAASLSIPPGVACARLLRVITRRPGGHAPGRSSRRLCPWFAIPFRRVPACATSTGRADAPAVHAAIRPLTGRTGQMGVHRKRAVLLMLTTQQRRSGLTLSFIPALLRRAGAQHPCGTCPALLIKRAPLQLGRP